MRFCLSDCCRKYFKVKITEYKNKQKYNTIKYNKIIREDFRGYDRIRQKYLL